MKKIRYSFVIFLFVFLLFFPGYSAAERNLENPIENTPDNYSDSTLEVHFLDVGKADCILLQTPGNKNILVDCGHLSTGYKVKEYLSSQDASPLERIIITHMHPDHVGGVFYILPQIQTDSLYYNGYRPDPRKNEFFFELRKLAENLGIPLKILTAGDEFSVGKVESKVLSPLKPFLGDMNADSVVLKVQYEDTDILLAGDLTAKGEKRLLKKGANLESEVLKIGHHGVASSSGEFIERVDPQIAVLSVGPDPRYQYPSDEVIQRFKQKNIPVYRTDKHGTIVVRTDGKSLKVETEN